MIVPILGTAGLFGVEKEAVIKYARLKSMRVLGYLLTHILVIIFKPTNALAIRHEENLSHGVEVLDFRCGWHYELDCVVGAF